MKKIYKVLLIILAILVIIRIFLPAIVLHYANKALEEVPGYYGHINDIDIALIRGAYIINTFYLNKVDSVTFDQTPFLSANKMDLSVEWRALFHGRLVGELQVYTPKLMFTKDKAESPDRSFNLYTWYNTPFYDKLYFQWDIIRNGSVISTKSDSTSLIQFGTKNFTLNY